MNDLQKLQLLRAATVAPNRVDLRTLLAVALDCGPGHIDMAVLAIVKNGTAHAGCVPALLRIAAKPFLQDDLAIRLLVAPGAQAVPGLTQALAADDERTRLVAAQALGKLGAAAAPALGPLAELYERQKSASFAGMFGMGRSCGLIREAMARIRQERDSARPASQHLESIPLRPETRLPQTARSLRLAHVPPLTKEEITGF